MRDEDQINPGHGEMRQIFRVVGPLLIIVGGVFMVIGMGSFFSAMGSFGPPQYFWCCFVGMPLLALGAALTKVGFLGAFLRYFAGEAAPVQKDTFNYLANGVRPGVKDLAQAVSEGLRTGQQAGTPAGSADVKYCSSCGQPVSTHAKFCSGCGLKLE